MKLIKFFRKQALQRAIRSRIISREIKYTSLSDAKYIGFIIDLEDGLIEESVSVLLNFCKKNRIKYSGVALDLGATSRNSLSASSNPYIQTIYKEEVNKGGLLENSDLLNDFIRDQFDILIDFTTIYTPLLHYLVSTSVAHFKTGSNRGVAQYYDFMLSNDKTDNRVVFINEMIKYLTSIQTA